MFLISQAIPDGSVIAKRYVEEGAGGENVRPDLAWGNAPAGTQSFALTCYDPDAPTGSGWWHWIAFDVPSAVTSLAEGEPMPEGAVEWVTDYGYLGYGGPCPPPGPAHRYVFTVHALDVPSLGIDEGTPQAAVRFTIYAHTLATASFLGTYGR